MAKCKGKHRTRVSKKHGTDHNRPSSKGHTWQKIIVNGEHIGRKCTTCTKQVLNPRAN